MDDKKLEDWKNLFRTAELQLKKKIYNYEMFLQKHYGINGAGEFRNLGFGTCIQYWLGSAKVLCYATEEFGTLYIKTKTSKFIAKGTKTAQKMEQDIERAFYRRDTLLNNVPPNYNPYKDTSIWE